LTTDNSTTKWIGIIAVIVVSITGWFLAGVQYGAAQRIHTIELEVKNNKAITDDVRMKQVAVMEQLIFIRQDIKEVKDQLDVQD
jgi:cell division septal protein FtsQ